MRVVQDRISGWLATPEHGQYPCRELVHLHRVPFCNVLAAMCRRYMRATECRAASACLVRWRRPHQASPALVTSSAAKQSEMMSLDTIKPSGSASRTHSRALLLPPAAPLPPPSTAAPLLLPAPPLPPLLLVFPPPCPGPRASTQPRATCGASAARSSSAASAPCGCCRASWRRSSPSARRRRSITVSSSLSSSLSRGSHAPATCSGRATQHGVCGRAGAPGGACRAWGTSRGASWGAARGGAAAARWRMGACGRCRAPPAGRHDPSVRRCHACLGALCRRVGRIALQPSAVRVQPLGPAEAATLQGTGSWKRRLRGEREERGQRGRGPGARCGFEHAAWYCGEAAPQAAQALQRGDLACR